MNYIFPDGTSLTIQEIRERVSNGQIDPNQTVIPEGGSDSITVLSLLGKPTAPPPLPNADGAPRVARTTPPPLRSPQNNVTPAKKTSLKWLWVSLAIVGVLAIGMVGFAIKAFNDMINNVQLGDQASVALFEDRKDHQTEWLDPDEVDFQADGEAPEPPEDVNLELVKYTSSAGELSAYLTPDPGDGKKHPAMVWAKGGFGGIGDFMWGEQSRLNDQSAREFRDAGIVLMCPSFRGENDNPGRFELFYGEVDDFIAAIEHVKSLPYVDPDRVYIGGHSIGGTIALLAAVSGSETDFRAAFSFGGRPDMNALMTEGEIGEGYGNTPYDHTKSPRDTDLRNPIRYTKFITSPTFYFEGEEDYYYDADTMQTRANVTDVPFTAFSVTGGDHFDILSPTTRLIAQKILDDTGETCNISFTSEEIDSAWSLVNDLSLASEIGEWLAKSGSPEELQVVLANLADDAIPTNAADIAQLESALKHLSKDESEVATMRISDLVDLGYSIEDDEIIRQFETDLVPLFHDYIRSVVARKTEQSEDTIDFTLWTVDTLMTVGTKESGKLTVELINANFGADSSIWSDVFTSMDPEFPAFEPIDTALRANPPAGIMGARLMEWNNDLFFDSDPKSPHYFDSKKGIAQIKEWLKPVAQGQPDYSFSSALALGFIKTKDTDEAFELGYAHPGYDIQLETAWAEVKSKEAKRGLEFLQEATLNAYWSETAKSYMIELNHEADIPEAALAPDFAAKAAMLKWLSHPNEIGGPPETIEQFDTREIFWPPLEDTVPLYLFKFTYRFDDNEPFKTAYGLQGGAMTWSSFEEFETPPSAEQLYVNHCALELSRTPGLDETEPLPVSKAEALKLLREKNPGEFEGEIDVAEE